VLSLLGLWDQLQQTRVLLMRLDDVLDQEPEQRARTARSSFR
jgi:ABC-type bacteriocin/lantibiotic exporter with double-glycine peptidase domain